MINILQHKEQRCYVLATAVSSNKKNLHQWGLI